MSYQKKESDMKIMPFIIDTRKKLGINLTKVHCGL